MSVRIRPNNMVNHNQTPIEDYDIRRKQFDGIITIGLPASGKCPFCDWKCHSGKSSTFAMHMSRKHAPQLGRAIDPYKCSQCDKRFCSRSNMNHHIFNHHEIILHNCPHNECTYQGKNKASVISHYMRRHMKHIVQRCEDNGGCVSCDRRGNINVYHMGVCHPSSPFHA